MEKKYIFGILVAIIIIVGIIFLLIGTLGPHYECKNLKCERHFFPSNNFDKKKTCLNKCKLFPSVGEIYDNHYKDIKKKQNIQNEIVKYNNKEENNIQKKLAKVLNENEQIKKEIKKLKNYGKNIDIEDDKITKKDFEILSERLLEDNYKRRENRQHYKNNRYYSSLIKLKDKSWFRVCLPCEKDHKDRNYIPFTNELATNDNSYASFEECNKGNNKIVENNFSFDKLTSYYPQSFWQSYYTYPYWYSCPLNNCRGNNCPGCLTFKNNRRNMRNRINENNVRNNVVNNNIRLPILTFLPDESNKNKKIEPSKPSHIIFSKNEDLEKSLTKSIQKIDEIEPKETKKLDEQTVLTMSEEIPPIPQEIPFMSKEIPPIPQEIPFMSKEIPPIPQEIPFMSEEIPPIPQEIPFMSEEIPPIPQEIPFMSEEIPQLPNISQDIPPMPVVQQESEEFHSPQDLSMDPIQITRSTNYNKVYTPPYGMFGQSAARNKKAKNIHLLGIS